jgi:hypothetical protein
MLCSRIHNAGLQGEAGDQCARLHPVGPEPTSTSSPPGLSARHRPRRSHSRQGLDGNRQEDVAFTPHLIRGGRQRGDSSTDGWSKVLNMFDSVCRIRILIGFRINQVSGSGS